MRLVFIAPDATRDRHRADLAAHGLQVLSETADRETALKMLAVLAPEAALVEVGADLDGPLTWAKEATAAAPGLYLVLMGPALPPEALLAVMRAGVREYLPTPTPAEVLEALSRAQAQLRGPAPKPVGAAARGGQVAVVYSPKGGAGKSTLAANLAVSLYQVTSQRVQLMDLSFQFGDLDLLLNLQPQKSIAELIPVMHDLDARALEQAITPSPIGVRLLAAPPRVEDAEALREEHIERTFEALRSQPGWTVVDCASHLDQNNCKAIELADVVLVPMNLDLASIRRVARAFELWKELGIDTAKVRLVAWADKGEITVADVARTLGRPVAHELPWDPAGVAAAINQGVPVMIGQPTAPLAAAIRQMASQLSGVTVEAKAKDGNPFGKLMTQAFGWLKKKDDVKLLTAGSGAN
jgi:pilus assembly protein CpaE